MIWVDDFPRDSAVKYLEYWGFNTTENYKIISTVGTRPVALWGIYRDLSRMNTTLNEILEEFMANAVTEVEQLALAGPNYKSLMCSLLGVSFAEGIHPKHTSAPNYVESAVTFKSKDRHAVLYHLPSKSYRFYSIAHYTAAQSLANELCVTDLVKADKSFVQ